MGTSQPPWMSWARRVTPFFCHLAGLGLVATPLYAGDFALRVLPVKALTDAPDLVCVVAAKPVKKAAKPSALVAAEPLVMPDEADVLLARQTDAPTSAVTELGLGAFWQPVAATQTFRVAFWGDSHLAAGFFTQELVKQLGLTAEQAHSAFIPATMNRPGVRLPVRKTCTSPAWRYESAHAWAGSAFAAGPALVNAVSAEHGASLAWDLRNAARQALHRNARFLYQQTQEPITVGVRVDGGEELTVVLEAAPGPAGLELQADQPISTLQIRLLHGSLRSHGLGLDVPASARLQLDLFALPGTTAKAWRQADMGYLRNWFVDAPPYQLVALAYGTNEGNEKPFNAPAYAQGLRQSVTNLRQLFPQASCLLIGPGDRGVLIARSRQGRKKRPKTPAPLASNQLLRYSHIHAQISKIQQTVGTELGCRAWSMYQAMGGSASAYGWARQRPQLMANDLMHYTVSGYQKLAQLFAAQMGWKPENMWNGVD